MKVSIITVSYNSEETIEDTVKSVTSQTHRDIEYIVIDGNSSDRTLSILERYKEKIDVLISEPDSGMYHALNKGIDLASGNLIGILNSDDLYIDDKVIAEVVSKVEEDNSDACYGDLVYVDRTDLNKVRRYWKSKSYRKDNFKWGWMPPHPTFFVRRECYEKFGKFNLELTSAADYELMLRMIHKYQINLSYIPRVLVKMREGGISNANIVNRIKANREDQKAWRINNLQPNSITLIFKPLRKIFQFISIKKPQD